MRGPKWVVLALAAIWAADGAAASFSLDRYRPAPTGEDGLALSRPGDLGHLRWGVRLDFDYAWNPLVLELDQGTIGSETGAVVEHHAMGRLVGCLGLVDRVVLWLGLPWHMLMTGTTFEGVKPPDGSGLGDVFLGARVRIWGDPGDLFALGAEATVSAATAEEANSHQHYSGERTFAGQATLLAEIRSEYVIVTANIGARFRKPSGIKTLDLGQELFWALGFTFPAIPDVLEVYLETWGTTNFADAGSREGTPVELLAGVRVWARDGLSVALAGGTGAGSRGYGAPDARALVTFGWALPIAGED